MARSSIGRATRWHGTLSQVFTHPQSPEFDATGGFHPSAVSRHPSVGACRLYFCEVHKAPQVNSRDWDLCWGAACGTPSRTTLHNSQAGLTSSNGKLLLSCADDWWLVLFPHYWPVSSASEEVQHYDTILVRLSLLFMLCCCFKACWSICCAAALLPFGEKLP